MSISNIGPGTASALKRQVVYCDESAISHQRYMVIGGIWCPQEKVDAIRQEMKSIRVKHHLMAEMKWNKVSAAFLDKYKAFASVFFDAEDLHLNCMVIDSRLVDIQRYYNGSRAVAYYSFMYQLLSRNTFKHCTYNVYVDKRNT